MIKLPLVNSTTKQTTMKTTLTATIGLLILVASACQQDSFLDSNQEQGNNNATPSHYVPNLNVSFESAKYAANLLSHSAVKSVTPIVPQPRDTIMYVVNCEKGWMLLSADKRVAPVLASSPSGKFDQNMSNEGVATLLNDFADNLLALKHQKQEDGLSELKKNDNFIFWSRMTWAAANKNEETPTNGTTSTRVIPVSPYDEGIPYLCKRLVSITSTNKEEKYIGERTKTKWGQWYPWNTNLPEVDNNGEGFIAPPTGCVAVAMAQLLYFTHFKFNVPSGLHHGVNFTGKIIDKDNFYQTYTPGIYVTNSTRWNEMPLSAISATTGSSYVADLMAELGYHLNMKYTPNGSGTTVSTEVMRNYGIAWDEGDYNAFLVEKSIENGSPVLITAHEKKSTTGWLFWRHTRYREGHAWLIDGVVKRREEMKAKYVWELVRIPMWTSPKEEHSPNNPKTLDDLWNKYEEVQPMDNAKRLGIYDGKVEYKSNYNDRSAFLMNWGWSGSGDNWEFASDAGVWSNDGHTYQYNKKIYYNSRPIK
jgi:putative pyrogenic exotoxin B